MTGYGKRSLPWPPSPWCCSPASGWAGTPRPCRAGARSFVDQDRGLRAELVDEIDSRYYKPVDPEIDENGSLKGIVAGLGIDFSHYFSPEETQEFEASVRATSRESA